MIQRSTIWIFFLLMATGSSAQQDTTLLLQRNFTGAYSYFTTDNLENIFLVNSGNQLKKLNANGDSVGVFNDVRKYGQLSSIDATNPLKLLLYYSNFATILTLDRFLNVRNSINLRQQNIFKVKCMAASYDNQIWIYDEGDAKLKKIGETGEVLQESTDFRNVFDTIPNPTQLIDRDGFLYLYDPLKGWYTFDYYGAFKQKLPLLHWQNVAVAGGKLYGFEEGGLYQYNLTSSQLKKYVLPEAFKAALQIRVGSNNVYALLPDGLQQYLVK